jgi:hypothetical protein
VSACPAIATIGLVGVLLAACAQGSTRASWEVAVYAFDASDPLADIIDPNVVLVGPEEVEAAEFPEEDEAVARIRRDVAPRFWAAHPSALESSGGCITVLAPAGIRSRVEDHLRREYPVVGVIDDEGWRVYLGSVRTTSRPWASSGRLRARDRQGP